MAVRPILSVPERLRALAVVESRKSFDFFRALRILGNPNLIIRIMGSYYIQVEPWIGCISASPIEG